VRSGATIVRDYDDRLITDTAALSFPAAVGGTVTVVQSAGKQVIAAVPGTGSPAIWVPGRNPLESHSITYANDQSQLLNWVVTSNTASPPITVQASDAVSTSRFGKRGRAFGLPYSALAYTDAAPPTAMAQRAINRFAYITRHVESFETDTAIDQGWLPALADLDTGRAVRIERQGIRPVAFDGAVVGWRHTIDPGRWVSTVAVSTTTPSL
jgi:hypothetical protein